MVRTPLCCVTTTCVPMTPVGRRYGAADKHNFQIDEDALALPETAGHRPIKIDEACPPQRGAYLLSIYYKNKSRGSRRQR
jgi:hypothetical protein